MADTIDFSKFAQTAIALQNLKETTRRNDISQQQLDLHQQQLEIEQQRNTQFEFKNVMDLADDPRVKANPELSDAAMTRAWKLAGNPEVSPELFAQAREQTQRILKAQLDKDPEAAQNAFIEMQTLAGPKDAKTIQESMSSFQKMREYTENVEAMRELQAASTEKVRSKMAKVNAGELPYQDVTRDFVTLLQGTDTPEFQRAMKLRGSIPQSKSTFLGTPTPALETFNPAAMQAASETSSGKAAKYGEVVIKLKNQLEMVDAGEPLPKGLSKRDLIEHVAVGQRMIDAYTSLAKWQKDPFNPTLLKDAQETKAALIQEKNDLAGLKNTASDDLSKIRQDALDFRKSEAGTKHFYEKNVGLAQTEVLEQYGYQPSGQQLAEVSRKYNVAPADVIAKLSDPSRKGKLDLTATFGREDQSRQYKIIEAAQSADMFIGKMQAAIKKNPRIIGPFAQLGTAFSGAVDQWRNIIKKDADVLDNFNTKTRDELEALNEMLVYKVARTMDQSGALDIKVVQHARETVGDINSWTTGPNQILNKLENVRARGRDEMALAQRRLKLGAKAYLGEDGGGEPQGSPLGSSLLKELRRIEEGATE